MPDLKPEELTNVEQLLGEEKYMNALQLVVDFETREDLSPEDDPITVNVEVVAPNEQNQQFDGEVKIVNSENSSDYHIISVSFVTPVNLQLTSSQSINLHTKFSKNAYQSTQILSNNSEITSCTTISISSISR